MFNGKGGLYALRIMTENTPLTDPGRKRLKKNMLTLIGTNFLQGLGWGIYYTIYQGFILENVGSESALGVIVGVSFLLQFLPMPFLGMLSDRIGRKLFILIGMGVAIIGLLVLGLSKSFWAALVGMYIFYLGWGFRDPAFQAAMNENVVGKRSGLIFSIAAFAFFGGNLIASYFVAQTSAYLAPQDYFLTFGALYALQILWTLLFYQDLPLQHPKGNLLGTLKEDLWGTWKGAFGTKSQRPIFIFFLFDGLMWGVGTMLFNGALKTQLNIGYDRLALILMGYNLSIIVTQIPVGKLIDRIGTKIAILLAEALGILFFLITILAAFLESEWQFRMLFLGQIVYGVALAFYIPAQMVIFTSSKKGHAAETYGIGMLMIGISILPATIIAGFLIEKIHFVAPLIFAVIFIPINTAFMLKKYSEKADS